MITAYQICVGFIIDQNTTAASRQRTAHRADDEEVVIAERLLVEGEEGEKDYGAGGGETGGAGPAFPQGQQNRGDHG